MRRSVLVEMRSEAAASWGVIRGGNSDMWHAFLNGGGRVCRACVSGLGHICIIQIVPVFFWGSIDAISLSGFHVF